MNISIHYNLSHLQPDVDDDDWNDDDDDERENSVPVDAIRPTMPILTRLSIKNQKLRRRQTIDTVQARQYSSQQQHRTALQQLQSMLWPTREMHNTIVNNNQSNEHEQMPMIAEKRTSHVQRSSSARENNQNIINDNPNEQRTRHRIQQQSDTTANV